MIEALKTGSMYAIAFLTAEISAKNAHYENILSQKDQSEALQAEINQSLLQALGIQDKAVEDLKAKLATTKNQLTVAEDMIRGLEAQLHAQHTVVDAQAEVHEESLNTVTQVLTAKDATIRGLEAQLHAHHAAVNAQAEVHAESINKYTYTLTAKDTMIDRLEAQLRAQHAQLMAQEAQDSHIARQQV